MFKRLNIYQTNAPSANKMLFHRHHHGTFTKLKNNLVLYRFIKLRI